MNPDPGLASWLQLALTPGLGPATFQRVLRQFGLPQTALAKSRAELASFTTPAVLAALDSDAVVNAVARSLAWAALPGCSIVTLADEAYPRSLLEIPDPSRRIALLEGALLEALRRGVERHPALPEALGWLQRHHGQGTIEALVVQLSIGQRRLERLFKRHVGLSPKQYARTLRIAHSRDLIKRGRGRTPLTDTAHEAGYFDQSHFIHDFTAVTGITPGGYLGYVRRRYGERWPHP